MSIIARFLKIGTTKAPIGSVADGEYLRYSSGQIVGGTPSGGSGAPTTSQYVTLATDATLTNERVLTAGAGVTVTDAGAGSTVTVAADFGTGAGKVTQGNDSRLSDARTPTAHATSHRSGGSDAIKLDELAAPTDVTTLNATAAAHGLLPKLSGSSGDVLRGDGTWGASSGGASFATVQTVAGFGGF